jgi:hypothetical protein
MENNTENIEELRNIEQLENIKNINNKNFRALNILNKIIYFNTSYDIKLKNINKLNYLNNFNDSININDLKYIFINKDNLNLLCKFNNYKLIKNIENDKYYYNFIKLNKVNYKNIENNKSSNFGYYFHNLPIYYLQFCKNYNIKISYNKLIKLINNDLFINLTSINSNLLNFNYNYEICLFILKNIEDLLESNINYEKYKCKIIFYIIKNSFKKSIKNINNIGNKKKTNYSNTVKQLKFLLQYINKEFLYNINRENTYNKRQHANENGLKYNSADKNNKLSNDNINEKLNNKIINYIIKKIYNKYFIQQRKKLDSNNSSKDTDNLKLHEYNYFDNPTYSNKKKIKIKRQLYFNKTILYLLITEFKISYKHCKIILKNNIDVLMYFNELDIISNCINKNFILAIKDLNKKYTNLIIKNNNYNENIINMIIKYSNNFKFSEDLITNIIKQNYYKIDIIINLQNYLDKTNNNLSITNIHRLIKYNFETQNFDNIIRIVNKINLHFNNFEYIKKKAIDTNNLIIYNKLLEIENSSCV